MTTAEIFSQLASHMVKGLMVHEQLANYYDFLGLEYFRREQEEHFIEESRNYRELCHFYSSHFNKLIGMEKVENPKIVPESWFKYTRFDVDPSTKRNGIENGFKEWKNWETTVLGLLERSYKELFNISEVSASLYVQKMIDRVEAELQEIDRMILTLKAVDYDLVYVSELN